MSSLLLILLSTVLVNIIALTSKPSWRPFAAMTGTFAAARALAIACVLAVPTVTAVTWLLADVVLQPLGLDYLRTPAFIAIILTLVPLIELALRRHGKLVPEQPAFALLMTINATLSGVAFIADSRSHSLLDALSLALGAAGALGFLLLAFAALHDRLQHADVPSAFREAPLALVTAGIMALAFMGFTGIIQE